MCFHIKDSPFFSGNLDLYAIDQHAHCANGSRQDRQLPSPSRKQFIHCSLVDFYNTLCILQPINSALTCFNYARHKSIEVTRRHLVVLNLLPNKREHLRLPTSQIMDSVCSFNSFSFFNCHPFTVTLLLIRRECQMRSLCSLYWP